MSKIVTVVFEKWSKKQQKIQFFLPGSFKKIFFEKRGSVSFLRISISNFWPKISKILRAVTEIWWWPTRSTLSNCSRLGRRFSTSGFLTSWVEKLVKNKIMQNDKPRYCSYIKMIFYLLVKKFQDHGRVKILTNEHTDHQRTGRIVPYYWTGIFQLLRFWLTSAHTIGEFN